MEHEHDQRHTCPHCPPKSNGPTLAPGAKTKLTSFLGVCGCISCYVAMFPALLLGVIGVLGLSTSAASGALNAYMASVWFQPILVVSILFLIAGIFRYGALPLWLSILGGAGIFVSMNFYMHAWLFTLSFALIAFAYFFAYRKTKAQQLKIALVLLLAVVVLGVVDIGRSVLPAQSSTKNTVSTVQTTQAEEITVRADKSSFEPSFTQIPIGSKVKLTVISEEVPHQIYIPDARIDEIISSGNTKVFEFTFVRASTVGFLCFVDCSRHDSMIPFLGADSTHEM